VPASEIRHDLKLDWPTFLDDFRRHWPTDEDIYVNFVRDGLRGNGAARMDIAQWRRLTEERARGAKSVFRFDVQGSVAKSPHAGIPWLRFIRQRLGTRVHFWPFDGWDIPAGCFSDQFILISIKLVPGRAGPLFNPGLCTSRGI
jgi:hypothetical protein